MATVESVSYVRGVVDIQFEAQTTHMTMIYISYFLAHTEVKSYQTNIKQTRKTLSASSSLQLMLL